MNLNNKFKNQIRTLCWVIKFLFSLPLLAQVDSINYDLKAYKSQNGLVANSENNMLTLEWDGDRQDKLRLQFVLEGGVPTIRKLEIRSKGETWRTMASNLIPEYHVVSGVRRVTQQQTKPLEKLGIALTEEKLNEIKWNAFWDAPLYLEDKAPPSHQNAIPASEAFKNHPGMPRKPEEVVRAKARYKATECEVITDGIRLEIKFPGVEAGIFKGYLQYTIFKGSNLIRQMLVARTDQPSVAF